jgi:ferredoxin-type protein NapH
LDKKRRSRRKTIRYFRWAVKAAFLLFFTLPIAYFVTAPSLPVYSLFNGGLDHAPLVTLPYGQSVCSIFLTSSSVYTTGPGAWLTCPVGGLQVLATGRTDFGVQLVLPTIIAILVFLIPIFVLGNMFCGWACPVGTMIDAFDKGVERFMPKLNAKREERYWRSREKNEATQCSAVCPANSFMRLLGNKQGTLANGVLGSALIGSAILRFPVFCTICPIGIATKGMFHLKALTSITGKMMPIILELWAIPVIAILASVREKRYWCRKICPVGAALNLAGTVSPLIKPTVKPEKCVMKECPKTCEDYHLDYCGACRQIDQKRCEKVCPQGIKLLDKESLARCTKCLECYIQCDHDSIEIKLYAKPDAFSTLRSLKAKLKRQPKNAAKPDRN